MSTANNNRASLKQKGKRQLLKHILESPFSYQWKRLDDSYSESIVKSLLQILQPHRQYRIARNQQRRQERDQKRKRAAPAPIADNIIIPPKPALCCSFGINECTKLLERRIKHRQQQQQLQSTIEVEDISSTQSPLLLFVCVDDVVIAPHMISHLPTLAHLASNVYLCPLPKGTESRLGDASGMKRVCCLAIVCGDDDSSKLTADGRESINDLLMAVKAHWDPVKLLWVCQQPEATSADNANIMMVPLRTSQRDMTAKRPHKKIGSNK